MNKSSNVAELAEVKSTMECKPMREIEPYLIEPSASIRNAMVCIDQNGKGICLVVNEKRILLGTVSDGDIRRAILKSMNLDLPVSSLLGQRESGPKAIIAPVGSTEADVLRLMTAHGIRQIPIVDGEGCVSDIVFMNDLVREYELPMTAVVMAGGFGTRLRPMTDNVPKPMLHVGDRPILQRTIEQLKKTGIHRISVTTHYKSEAISEHFGDGNEFGVEIDYVHEDQPLGTAGAISLMAESNEPLLIINGDILTHVDFRAMLDYHRKQNASLTVAVRQYGVQVPYGVIEYDGTKVSGVSEKPQLQFLVNAGIYLLEPSARKFIPSNKRFDMTDLIQKLVAENCRVASFPIVEYWLDVGQPADFAQAQEDVVNGRIS
jgi:dTDP-glucose pyrophosphorylase/CBS domain-containing protein